MTEHFADPIKVGMIVPFSGLQALRDNGKRMFSGTQSWINLVNERGGIRGRKIELMVEDSAYDIAVTAEKIRKLNEEDRVVALLNTNGSPQLTAAMPYLQEHRLPLLLPFAGDENWYCPPRWGIFGVQPPFNESGYLLGEWAARDGCRKVVVVHPHYPEISVRMAEKAVEGFNAAADHSGARAERLCVELGSTDGPVMADAIMSHCPDALVILVNWPELTAAVAALRERGITLPLYSWAANVTQAIAEKGGDLLEAMKGHAATIVTPDADTPAARVYREAMARYFPDQQPDITSMTAFAQAMIFTRALEGIGNEINRDSIVASFGNLQNVETGILPTVTFSPTDHMGIKALQPMQLLGGRWKVMGAPMRFPELRTEVQ